MTSKDLDIEPKIPIYEIYQKYNKVGIFFTQQLADKVNASLNKPKVYTKEEVIKLLNVLSEIKNDISALDIHNETGNGFLFSKEKETYLSNFNLETWIEKTL